MVRLALVCLLVSVAPAESQLFHYRVTLTAVPAGDAVTADFNLGMRTVIIGVAVRLGGIDAPGVRSRRGTESRTALRAMTAGRPTIVETARDRLDGAGRVIGTLWVLGRGDWCPAGSWCNANAALVVAGHAEFTVY